MFRSLRCAGYEIAAWRHGYDAASAAFGAGSLLPGELSAELSPVGDPRNPSL
jgi:hypothetical protein